MPDFNMMQTDIDNLQDKTSELELMIKKLQNDLEYNIKIVEEELLNAIAELQEKIDSFKN